MCNGQCFVLDNTHLPCAISVKITTDSPNCRGLRVSRKIQTLDGLIEMHQTALNGCRSGLRAIRHAEFTEQRVDVRFYGSFRNF